MSRCHNVTMSQLISVWVVVCVGLGSGEIMILSEDDQRSGLVPSDWWQNTNIVLLTLVHLFLPSSDPTSTFDKNTIALHTSSQLLSTPDRSYTIKLSQSERCSRSQEGFLANQKPPFSNVKLTVKPTLYSPNWFFTKQSHLDFIKFLE